MSVISMREVAPLCRLSTKVTSRMLCTEIEHDSILMQVAFLLRYVASTGINLQQDTRISYPDGTFYLNSLPMHKSRNGYKLSKKDPTFRVLSEVLPKCSTTGYRTESFKNLLAYLGDSNTCIWGQISLKISASDLGAFLKMIDGNDIVTKTSCLGELQQGSSETDYKRKLLKVITALKRFNGWKKPMIPAALWPKMYNFESLPDKSRTLISEVEELDSDRLPNIIRKRFKSSESTDENGIQSPPKKPRKCPDETKLFEKQSEPLEVSSSGLLLCIDLPQEFKEYRSLLEYPKSTSPIVNQQSSWFKSSLQLEETRKKICKLCFETVAMKKFFTERRFGVFPKCDCVICYGCIRRKVLISDLLPKGPVECPSCSVKSDTVASSSRWIEGEAKETFFRMYRENTATLHEKNDHFAVNRVQKLKA